MRVYGQLTHSTQSIDTEMNAVDTPNEHTVNVNDTPDTPSDDLKVVGLLENQIADLRSQLKQSTERENALMTEKSKLLDMLSTEQEKSRLLMLPAPEAHTKPKQKTNWVQRLLRIQTS